MQIAVLNKTGVLLITKNETVSVRKKPVYWVGRQQRVYFLNIPPQTPNVCRTVGYL